MPPRSSAAPSLAPLALSASLAAPQFSAASGGAQLASAHSTLSPSYLRDPRLAPQSSAFPSFAGWSSASLRFRLTLLSIVGLPLALPMVVGQPRALTLFLRPRLAHTLLRWPLLALLLLRIHPLALGFLLQLRSLVQCRSFRGPQPVALRSLDVRRSDLPPFLIVFPPGFRLSTPGCMFELRLYIAVCRLYRLFCPVRGDAVRSPMPRCHDVRIYVLHGEGCGLLLGVTTLSLYVSFGSLSYVCPSLKCPVGLCYMDTGSDECLGFLWNSSSHFPGLCCLVLTCSHDSLFLRYPAIDIVWRGPVFLALGFLRHLALCGSAWWSPGPG